MKEILLEMKNVTKRFPGVIALNRVSLKLYKGEILALCGENGAGKSTLMKVLSGSFNNDYEGEIVLSGHSSALTSVRQAEKLGIEMIYQEVNMMLDASVAENLFIGSLPGSYGMVDFKSLYEKTEELLRLMPSDICARQPVRSLNSGQLQILSILRAIGKKPRILVLDEPTSALTIKETDMLLSLLKRLRSEGVSCIYISHKLDEVFRISDRIMVMRDGELVSERNTEDASEQSLIEEMVGRPVEGYYQKQRVDIGEEILRVEDLCVPHPTRKSENIVENISFTLHKGEILGIAGLVGAGRSEILGAIFGQYVKGVTKKLYLYKNRISIKKPRDAINAGIGFVTEERKATGIVGVLSIRENISLASLDIIPGKFFINKSSENKSVQALFDMLGIKANSIEALVRTLSGGNQQKVVLGKWLHKKPAVLLIDEPTRGIDVGARSEIYKWLSDLAKQGLAIVMVSSDMPEIISMCDRCLVVSNKRISRELSKSEMTQDAIMAAAIS